MNARNSQKRRKSGYAIHMLLFPASVLVAYGLLYAIMPDRTFLALKSSGNVLWFR